MRQSRLVTLASTALVAAAFTLPAIAGPSGATPSASDATPQPKDVGDSLSMPWQKKYDDVRQQALAQRLKRGGTGVSEKVAPGTYGKIAQTGTDKIFVVLAEFGDTRHSAYPDGEDSEAQRFDGPLHNEIPKPDRSVDNSTVWQSDYDQSHYQDMYFKRMKKFYEDQSSGQYSVDGTVTDWVKVPFNEARYGRDYCGSIACSNTWYLIRDALSTWTQDKLDAGWSMDRITKYLKTFDTQDRYDYDNDGDFNEPDGYIDHFQIVHAGGDQADGDPIYAGDAIWSHRWYAQVEPYGTGPVDGGQFGGVNVGEGGVSDPDGADVALPDNPTGVWVGDYTIQPENGGLSVFAHEFGHDLGLPDLYDTSGNTGGAENSVGFWSLMSQSRGTGVKDSGIGERPMPFGAWEKFQLGWLDYDVARTGRTSYHYVRPGASTSGKQKNGLIVLLPDKSVTKQYGAPCDTCGERYYYSGQGDDLDNTMTYPVEGGGELTAKVDYSIESGYDYAYLAYSNDDGDTWSFLETSQSTDPADGGTSDGTGITGESDGWVDLSATVPDDATDVRFEYVTDGGYALPGFKVDDIALAGTTLGTAEAGAEGWELDGFTTTTGEETDQYTNAYFVDNRSYVGRDRLLKHLYNFVGGDNPNEVEFFRNGPGALITYWDTSVADNNVGDHPGSGEILPVDAHPNFIHTPDGSLARPRTATFDSAFGPAKTGGQTLHYLGDPFQLPRITPERTFDDNLDWWFDSDEHGTGTHEGRYQPGWYSVDVPKTGTTIFVKKIKKKNNVMVVKVHPSK
ncbi:immune inhibitor A domain-containing protein [Nocardioides acrostichi]|uniref:immune inhibitor A domain-containing protein n=1 Tax=Nocardioides acrostichi TaxID=2784339 RepID=UPI001A9C814C|nr:immune inhibitor A domain-containing protein [Nocardioides acrostichi]